MRHGVNVIVWLSKLRLPSVHRAFDFPQYKLEVTVPGVVTKNLNVTQTDVKDAAAGADCQEVASG